MRLSRARCRLGLDPAAHRQDDADLRVRPGRTPAGAMQPASRRPAAPRGTVPHAAGRGPGSRPVCVGGPFTGRALRSRCRRRVPDEVAAVIMIDVRPATPGSASASAGVEDRPHHPDRHHRWPAGRLSPGGRAVRRPDLPDRRRRAAGILRLSAVSLTSAIELIVLPGAEQGRRRARYECEAAGRGVWEAEATAVARRPARPVHPPTALSSNGVTRVVDGGPMPGS